MLSCIRSPFTTTGKITETVCTENCGGRTSARENWERSLDDFGDCCLIVYYTMQELNKRSSRYR